MSLSDLSQPFREALACHVMLLNLGILADNIFVCCTGGQLYVIAKKSKLLAYRIPVAELSMGHEEFTRAWVEATDAFNEADTQERVELMNGSKVRAKAALIVTELTMIGFDISNPTTLPN